MRTVFLGTSDFAVGVLTRLAASPHRPALVVTRPDRPRGRGRRLQPPPVAVAARELGLPVSQPDRINDPAAVAEIAGAEPEALALCAYGALIGTDLVDAYEIFNVHPSLLPRWRGAAPVERAIMAGDRVTGVSIMRLTEGLDEGPVCLAGEEPIAEDDDFGRLAARLERLGGELLVRALDERPRWVEQPEEGVTYADKLTAEDRILDPARPAAELARRTRALTPHVGARVALPDGSALGVAAPAVLDRGPAPGTVEGAGDRVVLGCADGGVAFALVQPPGGRWMGAADLLRGRGLPA